jgi:hypothetical protein
MSSFDDVGNDEAVVIAKLALDGILRNIVAGRIAGAEIRLMHDVRTDTVRMEMHGPAMTRANVDALVTAFNSGNDDDVRVLPRRWLADGGIIPSKLDHDTGGSCTSRIAHESGVVIRCTFPHLTAAPRFHHNLDHPAQPIWTNDDDRVVSGPGRGDEKAPPA